MNRGQLRKEALVLLLIVFVAVGTVLFLWAQVSTKRTLTEEGSRMRQVYVGLSLYEPQYDGELPPELPAVRYSLSGTEQFTSEHDPFAKQAGPFPADAGLPGGAATTSFRVSDSYLYAHVRAGKFKAAPWKESKFDATLGLLANEWMGGVKPEEGFRAEVSGVVLRVTTDGSLVRVERGGPKPLGDAEDLFRHPPVR